MNRRELTETLNHSRTILERVQTEPDMTQEDLRIGYLAVIAGAILVIADIMFESDKL